MKLIILPDEIRKMMELPSDCEIELLSDVLSVKNTSGGRTLPNYNTMSNLLIQYKNNQKLQFIKIIRETFDCGLKEAKDFSDEIWHET